VDELGLRLAMTDASLNTLPKDGGLMLTAIKPLADDVRKRLLDEKRWGRTLTDESVITVSPQDELARVIDGGTMGTSQVDIEGRSQELSYATLSVKPWRYVVLLPSSVATAPAAAAARRLTIIGTTAAI